jgi:hypothetical protein
VRHAVLAAMHAFVARSGLRSTTLRRQPKEKPMTPFRITSRSLALVAAVVVVQLAGLSGRADATTLTLVGSSQKICQLTGDTDWTTNQPTAAQTDTNAHLVGVDLGFPVDAGPGHPLYFLFGDAFPSTTGNPIPPDDAIGYTTRTAAPDSETCLDLKLVTQGGAFAHPTVTPAILQGSFNVPTGGVVVDQRFFAFFWTDHCVALPPTPLGPLPRTPLQLPAPYLNCPQIPQFNTIGHSVLAFMSGTAPAAFEQERRLDPPSGPIILPTHPEFAGMPSGFVYVSAAPGPQVRDPGFLPPRLPGARPKTFAPVFGVARYRASIPYLAMAPQETFADPATWLFYAGPGAGGVPKFVTRAEWESGHTTTGQWTPPPGAELYADSVIGGVDERCVGEHSVTYNAALRTWLLLYACGPRVETRTAPDPWGPWSPPTKLISVFDPGIACTLIMNPITGCGPLKPNFWAFTGKNPGGFFYAPFALERFTQDVTPPDAVGYRSANIFWLVSTWNPYQVIVMQSQLQLTPN